MNIKTSILFFMTLATGSGVYAQTPLRPDAPAHIPTHAPSGDVLPEQETTPAEEVTAEPYAWKILPPLGLREPSTIDTLYVNYAQRFVPSLVADAYGTTGNFGAPGRTLLYFEREPMSDFFFTDALRYWKPSLAGMKFYNTRIPMTLLSYNNAGGKENAQDRLHGIFSGNVDAHGQVGAMIDYLYSKGCYDYQATKHLNWGFSGSYIGDRYEFQGFFNHWNMLNMENGGITDDLYITDPAQLQGGQASIQPKAIPTNLTGAFNRVSGAQLYLNNTYNVGFWKEEEVDDTTTVRTYVPVTRFVWTLDYQKGRHTFRDTQASDTEFWKNTYLYPDESNDRTNYWSLSNTLGVQLIEEFNKFAKFGLSAFVTHQIRNYKQTTDTIDRVVPLPDGLSPYPVGKVPGSHSENLLWVGGQLTKQRGSILTYDATARFGLIGPAVGDLEIDGRVNTRFPLFGDSVSITGYGRFRNVAAPYLMNHYVSNHFIWDNDFGKTRSLRLGGILNIPHTRTYINAGVENVQNLIYFGPDCLPVQAGGSVQVVSASLHQDFKFGPLVWQNRVTLQTSSDETVIPLPKLAVYSNLSLNFKVAGVLHVQLGVDCDYYTKYKSIDYQPATMTFYNQRTIDVGGYPLMNAFANMKLSKVRFYVMMSHVNQGMMGDNYFSLPHYPINPRRFQMGLSVDFPN